MQLCRAACDLWHPCPPPPERWKTGAPDRGGSHGEAESRATASAPGRAGRCAGFGKPQHALTGEVAEREKGEGKGTGVGVWNYPLVGVYKHPFQLA